MLSFFQLSHIYALMCLAMFLENHAVNDHSNLVYILWRGSAGPAP